MLGVPIPWSVKLKELCDKLGVEAHLNYPGSRSPDASAVAVLKAKLIGE